MLSGGQRGGLVLGREVVPAEDFSTLWDRTSAEGLWRDRGPASPQIIVGDVAFRYRPGYFSCAKEGVAVDQWFPNVSGDFRSSRELPLGLWMVWASEQEVRSSLGLHFTFV